MSKFFHRLRRAVPTDGELAAEQAAKQVPVMIDVARMQRSLQSPSFVMPSGLTPEEKRQFILAVALCPWQHSNGNENAHLLELSA